MAVTGAATATRLRTVPRIVWALVLAAVVGVLYLLFANQFLLPHDNDAPLFGSIRDIREWIDTNRNSNVILSVLVTGVRMGVRGLFDFFDFVLKAISWPALTVIGAAVGFVVGGWRLARLMAAGFLAFGILGFWERSVETLALTLAAVSLSLLIGIPLGIVAGRNDRFMDAIRPVLDVMQIMPTFSYLAPIALFFLIGPATAVIATLIYSIPPAIRITALGIRGVAPASLEAATSLGATRSQLLTKVQLPMARRTIILGVNQVIMMALSMVVITALVNAPGLGKDIIHALQQADVGLALEAGLAVVVMAIMLDRLTTQASERLDPARGRVRTLLGSGKPWIRWAFVAGTVAAVVLATVLVGNADFPSGLRISFRGPVNDAVAWFASSFYFATDWIRDAVTYTLINPIEGFLASSPWWLVAIVVVGLAFILAGRRQAVTAGLCLVLILALQVWEHSMITLAQVLLATAITLSAGFVLGILSARSDRFSMALRPVLDAAQTMPAFVYLIPSLALFGPTRFTAIIAAVVYAVPPVIRLAEVGIRTVPATIREAAVSAGATPRQVLWKVDLPLARPALMVAINQGIIMVLAMVVVGGLVGSGGLGFDVVKGFVRQDWFGQGLAAGLAIVLLGILLDRVTQGAGMRNANRIDGALPKAAA
ncbi:MAG: ABC transporter permease subunit [Chloroflexi bacterium]|nr:ABC transporter permease subunit [Chloroflexota bacterium]